MKLNEPSPKWTKIRTSGRNTSQFAWELDEGYGSLNMDIPRNEIQIPKETRYVPENTCIATTIALAFVLCQPRHPPMKIETKNRVKTEFLLAAGLYTSFLPRWYHETCYGSWFYQMYPDIYRVIFGEDYDEYICGNINVFDYHLDDRLNFGKKEERIREAVSRGIARYQSSVNNRECGERKKEEVSRGIARYQSSVTNNYIPFSTYESSGTDFGGCGGFGGGCGGCGGCGC